MIRSTTSEGVEAGDERRVVFEAAKTIEDTFMHFFLYFFSFSRIIQHDLVLKLGKVFLISDSRQCLTWRLQEE